MRIAVIVLVTADQALVIAKLSEPRCSDDVVGQVGGIHRVYREPAT